MASCITSQWTDTGPPQMRLTVTQSASTDTSATLSWKLEYIASSEARSNPRSYQVVIDGNTVKESSYDIYGKVGTYTVASGTVTITKGTSARNVPFSVTVDWNLTWSGVYKGSLSASSSISVAAKTSYSVEYNANGGSGAPSAQTKWHGTNLTLSSTKPTRTGHSFQGWALTDAEADAGEWYYQPGGTCGKNENLTLYAVWKANTYKVSYNANGGSGAPSAQTKTYGVTLKLSSTKPTRANYTFKGWATSASAATASYAAGGNYTTNAATTLYAVWELSYVKPRITNLSVARCDENGMASESGAWARVSFNWTCDRTLSAIVVEFISSDTISHSLTTAQTNDNDVDVVLGGDLSPESTYTVRVTVSDSAGNNSASRTLNGIRITIDRLVGGNGVSFGKPAEMEGYVDFGWDAHFDNYLGIYGRSLSGDVKLAFQPQNENGNTVIGWGNYNKKSGNTNLYGHDVLYGVSNIKSPSTFRPYIRQGDSFDVTIYTSGFFTNGGADMYFFVPLTRPVIGSPTVTATSRDGFQLRQNGKYVCGSTASAHAFPSSYTVTNYWTYGMLIKATFADTTNVDNNDTVGVRWSGTLTFT